MLHFFGILLCLLASLKLTISYMMLSLPLFSVLFSHPIFLNISLFRPSIFLKLSYGADFSMYCTFSHSFSTSITFFLTRESQLKTLKINTQLYYNI